MSGTSKGFTRRVFLRKGIFGGAALALGSMGWLALRPTRPWPMPGVPLRVLSPREYAIVMALASRMVPERSGFVSINAVDVGARFDATLSLLPIEAARDVKRLLALFDNALMSLWSGYARPFSTLATEEQDFVLAEWRDSRLLFRRTGFEALRKLVVASYYSDSRTWASSGYAGPPSRDALIPNSQAQR